MGGVCLTSACISLAISRLTRSIWRSLQGSPLLPSPSLAQPSMAQLDLVATVCPHPQSQSAPSLDPIQAPAIMSSLIWTCHTSPDTYPRHAVTFCPVGAKKHSQGFLPLLFSSTFPVVLFSLFFSFFLILSRSFPHVHTRSVGFYHSLPSFLQPLTPYKPTCLSPLPFVIQTCVFVCVLKEGDSNLITTLLNQL